MNSSRPINLNLWRLKFPVMAIASILHRVSGVVIFLSLPLLLYLFHQSLHSSATFAKVTAHITNPFIKLILWGVVTAVLYHLFAGIRHMVMDLGYAESLSTGRTTAYVVIVLTIIITLLYGVWLWHI